jgi:oxygen-independent coproporphyrinogen-3 oxidase
VSGNSTTFEARASEAALARSELRETLAYVHFPYCLKKCPYCDFTSYPAERPSIPHARYADAVLAELEAKRPLLAGRRLVSIFFGGGTPSLWEPEELGRVVASIRGAFEDVADDLEVTAESNPTSLDEDRARRMRTVGVNRISVGVQSLDPERLRFLGRLHDEDGGLRAIGDARAAGFERVSGDLIFGVAGGRDQSPEDAASEALRVADTGVGHVSAYGLTIEQGTQFGALARRGKLPIATDERLADAFLAVEAALTGRGFVHYETSNYARPGDEARHNLGYWRGLDYLGLGCGAVGTLESADRSATRTKNTTDPSRYMRLALGGEDPAAEVEVLDPETRLKERIMLGLRLDRGIDLEDAARRLGVTAFTPSRTAALEALVRKGWVVVDGGTVKVSPPARLFADGIAAELF